MAMKKNVTLYEIRFEK